MSVGDCAVTDNDASISQQISTELNRELAWRDGLTVILEGGCVNLYGFVSTIEQRNRAGDIARRCSGVLEVKNHISVNLF
jgi:osmotically-inducible protein OsmY